MDMHTRHELTKTVLKRYLGASKEEKTKILDEYCANTGYDRKYAIAKLRTYQLTPGVKDRVPGTHTRARPRVYDMKVEEALHTVWEAYDFICAERLHPHMGEAVDTLIRFGELTIDPWTEAKLRGVSLGTLKNLLIRIRVRSDNRIMGTTKPGTLLKNEIPLRVGLWDDAVPGFLEVDTVAHCGDSVAGMFAHTVNATDVATGWFEAEAVLGKAQERVHTALKDIQARFPIPLRGLDSDNGYEFINWELYRWCEREHILFTRSRPYKKNDNAHIEQKNWMCVRKVLGYIRIEAEEQVLLMNALYRGSLRDYINFFLPSVKCVERVREGSHIKKTYDKAQTPYQRMLAHPDVPRDTKSALTAYYETLNPVKLRKEIAILKRKIMK